LLDINVISVIKEGAGERWRAQPGSNLNRLDGVDMAKPYIPYTGPIINRAEAKAKGLKRYFTGKPCGQGHIAERIVSNRACVSCPKTPHRPGYHAEWRLKNPGKSASYTAKWREDHPWHGAEYMAARRDENRSEMRAKERERYARRKDHFAEKGRVWRKANKALIAQYARNRRAMKKAAEGTHTVLDVKNIFRNQRGKCAWCRNSIKNGFHADHIVPLFLGGSNWPKNIQLLCKTCNLKKSCKDPIIWSQEQGRLL